MPKAALHDWRLLRAMRSSPPGLAGGDDARRAVFQAALEQSEQLFDAAEAVGVAARPLPLFYGLSQAGRALLAARLPGTRDDWHATGHGIKSDVDVGDIRQVTCVDHGKVGLFRKLAHCLRSPSLPEAVTFDRLVGRCDSP